MAIDILERGHTCVHEPKHDLESVFYVLIWICVLYDGPNDSERQKFSIFDTDLKSWLVGDSSKDISSNKYAMLTKLHRFKSEILDLFTPYFEDLKPCISALRDALFSTTPITHEIMIDILKKTFDTLPEIEDWAPKDAAPPQRSKRKLNCIVEEDENTEDGEDAWDSDSTVEKLGDDESPERPVELAVSKAASCPSNLPSRKPSKRVRPEELATDV